MPKSPVHCAYPICLAIAETLRASRLETVLTGAGYEVLTFKSAREIWDNFEWRRPRYIILDGKFPKDDFSALDLCRAVRQQYILPYVYIHVLGSPRSGEQVDEVLDAGASDFSVKPVTPAQLQARVRVGVRWLEYIDSITAPPDLQPTKKGPPSGHDAIEMKSAPLG